MKELLTSIMHFLVCITLAIAIYTQTVDFGDDLNTSFFIISVVLGMLFIVVIGQDTYKLLNNKYKKS